MPENIIDVGHASISFQRADCGELHPCTFCKRPTSRGLAHKLVKDANWQFLPSCDSCHNGVRRVPTRDGELPGDKNE